MTNERFEELLNREIDGVATPQEIAEVNAYLEAHPDARQLRDDVHRLSGMLRNVEEVKPPAGLKSYIMASVPQGRTDAVPRFSVVTWVRDLIATRTTFQYAYVFAAGLVVGVAVYSLVAVQSTSTTDPASVAGSILFNSTVPFKDGPGFEVNLAEKGIQAEVQTKHSESLVVVDVRLQSQSDLALRVQCDQQQLRFKGYSQSRTVPANITLFDNGLVMTSQGENHYILAFERGTVEPSEISFVFEASGTKLYEERVQVGQTRK
jgi:hypothetical protein